VGKLRLGYTIRMTAPTDSVQTIAQIDKDSTQNIAANLQQAGHQATPESITPVTAETPIPKSSHMEAIGAQIIGEDIAHVVGSTVGDLTMGVQKTRITPSKRFLGKLLERLNRKKKPGEVVMEK
jgi:hypothetical protein